MAGHGVSLDGLWYDPAFIFFAIFQKIGALIPLALLLRIYISTMISAVLQARWSTIWPSFR
jgi:hypothetical protein